ncbi:hypothetical protein PV382_15415 [Streptomyces scabiei]|uniref:hypothetical protein n=1 Tax=Streptomyces scabiei TaxID=1930 RepID=UPI0029BD5B3E|nr:hypothetical protein [Streptomyces scabiei]MDX2994103.1 hypothetical protein [Streptomyces scabiei]MDX3029079.1 hypothetical protein [Streptomyces scabiei]MDX3047628.1 hypothetical protein [Streptomyces scabiei]MDX3173675.1 hypothetical protein [Streptomyces scabiei]
MAHTDPASPVVLVVGDTSTPEALADLTAFAHDVADRLQLPAEIALGMDYVVTDYEGVVLSDTYLDSVPSVVLGTEALEADMFVIPEGMLRQFPIDERCGHCGTDGDAGPVLVGRIWTTSLCRPCVEGAARVTSTRSVAVAA